MTTPATAGTHPAAAAAAAPAGPTGISGSPAPAIQADTWLDAAVIALRANRRPLRARDIVEIAVDCGFAPASRTRTPAQSVNRDLHAAVRRGDARIQLGPRPGQFCGSDVDEDSALLPAAARSSARPAVARLPIEPLAAAIDTGGGLRGCGLRTAAGDSPERARWVERLSRAYLRSKVRGWISVYDADELSIKVLGVHPALIWGDGWWESELAAAATGSDAELTVDDTLAGDLTRDLEPASLERTGLPAADVAPVATVTAAACAG